MKYDLYAPIYEYIDNVVKKAIGEEKKLIIWGVDVSGRFIRHLIEDIDGRLTIDRYIDEKANIYFNEKLYRSSILEYIDCKKYIVLNSTVAGAEIYKKCQTYGFVMGENFFDFREDTGKSYLDFLGKKDALLDFVPIDIIDRPDLYEKQIYIESTPFQHSSVERVFDEIDKFDTPKKFFDYGCGKGQILLTAFLRGYEKVGGIDINKDCVEAASNNLSRLGYRANIVLGDAKDYQDIDDFNIFFVYNPFSSEILIPALNNVEKSYRRKKRKIYIVYGNPFSHSDVVEKTKFRLTRQIRVDLYDPLLNIYEIE